MFILTKKPIFSFLKKFVNKQKNHKKITFKNWLLASWEEDKDLLFCIDFCRFDVLHPAVIERAWPPNNS